LMKIQNFALMECLLEMIMLLTDSYVRLTEYGNCTVSGNNCLLALNMQFFTTCKKQVSIQSIIKTVELLPLMI
ncbi:hypothetical protein T09_8646, partial [Trichinella sp. T9]